MIAFKCSQNHVLCIEVKASSEFGARLHNLLGKNCLYLLQIYSSFACCKLCFLWRSFSSVASFRPFLHLGALARGCVCGRAQSATKNGAHLKGNLLLLPSFLDHLLPLLLVNVLCERPLNRILGNVFILFLSTCY